MQMVPDRYSILLEERRSGTTLRLLPGRLCGGMMYESDVGLSKYLNMGRTYLLSILSSPAVSEQTTRFKVLRR
jgi:hypothetical protein